MELVQFQQVFSSGLPIETKIAGLINPQVGLLQTTKMAHTPLRIDYVHNQSQAHRSWVAVMVEFCRLFFVSFFSLISYARPDSQTTLYTEFESIDWLLIANWIRKECACLCWEAGAFKFHWLHTDESDGWRLFSAGIRTTVVMWAPSGPYNTRPHLKSLLLRRSGGWNYFPAGNSSPRPLLFFLTLSPCNWPLSFMLCTQAYITSSTALLWSARVSRCVCCFT